MNTLGFKLWIPSISFLYWEQSCHRDFPSVHPVLHAAKGFHFERDRRWPSVYHFLPCLCCWGCRPGGHHERRNYQQTTGSVYVQFQITVSYKPISDPPHSASLSDFRADMAAAASSGMAIAAQKRSDILHVILLDSSFLLATASSYLELFGALVSLGPISAALRPSRAQAVWEYWMWVACVLDLPHPGWTLHWGSSAGSSRKQADPYTFFSWKVADV